MPDGHQGRADEPRAIEIVYQFVAEDPVMEAMATIGVFLIYFIISCIYEISFDIRRFLLEESCPMYTIML